MSTHEKYIEFDTSGDGINGLWCSVDPRKQERG